MKNNTKTALVTGSSMGIGYEIAKQLAERGTNLVLVARSEDKLEHIAEVFRNQYDVEVKVIAKDLMETGAAEALYNEVKTAGIQVDILVNNAGQGVNGLFVENDLQQELDIINLNVISLVVLTKLFLKDMHSRNEGMILQVASVVDKTFGPLMSVYSGTKSFVYNFTQSVINELKDSEVIMTSLIPGATDTDFFNKAGGEDSKIAQDKDGLDDPAKVAKAGIEALFAGKSRTVSGLKNKTMTQISNITPDQALASKMHEYNDKADK
jgi:uncharacterized protein